MSGQSSNQPKFIQFFSVVEDDLDEMHHVNNLRYLQWALRAATDHTASLGWPAARLRSLGLAWIVRSHSITYKVPAILEDQVRLETWVSEVNEVSAVRRCDVMRHADSRTFARCETRWAIIDTGNQKLARIPTELQQALAGFAAAD